MIKFCHIHSNKMKKKKKKKKTKFHGQKNKNYFIDTKKEKDNKLLKLPSILPVSFYCMMQVLKCAIIKLCSTSAVTKTKVW